ncbi:MAG: TolC family outer membrane protein [Gammaproteobacteria bacterium]
MQLQKIPVYALLTASLITFAPRPAAADDLLSVYLLALEADPQYQAAAAAHAAALETLPQSRATLLPGIALTGNVSRDRFDPRTNDPATYATNKTFTVQLRQALYQRERFVQLQQADSVIAQADAEFVAAQQDLITRVATRYFLVLGALDNQEFVKADKDAIARTLDQAQQRFEVGLAAITDTLEAQARYDLAISEEIEAGRLLDDTREALRELTGQLPESPEILQDVIPLAAPEPASPDTWVTTALDQNPLMLAARAATEVARQEIQVQRSGHYPSVDMTANYSYRDNRFGGIQDLKRNDSAIGVELSLPLYQGGLVSSQTRQSRHEFTQAQEQQVQQHRATERAARNNYRSVITGVSKVEALQQAVRSNEKALEAAETGFEVGTRTIVDVLDAQRELLRARRDHARERYNYLLDTLRLKQAAGILEQSDLEQMNNLLN